MLPDVLPALQTLATSNLIGTLLKHIIGQSEKTYHLKHKPRGKIQLLLL
jgi:hypothetical protein